MAALRDTPREQISGFVLKATLEEKKILEIYTERQKHHYQRIRALKSVSNGRVILNHSQVAALVDALAHLLPLSKQMIEETQAFIEDMASDRQQVLELDHKIVQEFWEAYDYLNGNDDTPRLNHSRKEDQQIAINLNHFVEVAADRRQQIPDMNELKKLLKTSRTRKFIGIKTVNSGINAAWNARRKDEGGAEKPSTVKCWVFENSTERR